MNWIFKILLGTRWSDWTILLALLLISSGCTTSGALRQSSAASGKTLADLEYQMVLDNVASFVRSPSALPSQSQIAAGLIQVNDTFGLGNSSLSYSWSPWAWAVGFSANRKWQESWTIVPVTDPPTLDALSQIYSDAANQPWIQHGMHPPASSVLAGHAGLQWVWVDPKYRAKLTDLTLSVIGVLPKVKPTSSGPAFMLHDF